MHVSTSPKFWDGIGEKFYTKYKGIDRCHQEWAATVVAGNPIVGPLGREWEFSTRDKKNEFYIPWTTLTNYPVQGTGADIMAIARVSLARRLKALGWPVLLVSTVHDSIVVDAPPEYTERVVNLMHQVFDDLQPNIKKLFGYDWVVPMSCEVKIGLDMKNMKGYARTDK
jgi:DNA polymerase I-like protein with 3'-5' exonuclease and polymerase domains